MPNTHKLRYYDASVDIAKMIINEKTIGNDNWKQQLLQSLIVVPKSRYRNINTLRDTVAYAHLAKIVGITTTRPNFTISKTRSQFVLADVWTNEDVTPNYLEFVQHDYNTATKAQIAREWEYWRQQEHRDFAKKLFDLVISRHQIKNTERQHT